jgi:type VI secretion system protein ImpC
MADMDNLLPEVRSWRPLCKAEVVVENVKGEAGRYRVGLKVWPHSNV